MNSNHSSFYKGILTLITIVGALVSGYLVLPNIGLDTLLVFSVKAFLIGATIGVAAMKKRRVVIEKYRLGIRTYKKYAELEDPSGFWFILGFGLVAVTISILLVTESFAFTTLFVFASGFMFVYSDAADELVGAHAFVRSLAYLLILITCFVIVANLIAWLPPM
ncbi:MAG: hypothetical protein ACE5H4_14565 [Candidatus Thorarchaeota archaeon]